MLGPWVKVNWCGQTGDGGSEHQHFRNQWTKTDGYGWISFRWPLYLPLWARIPRKKWSIARSQQKSLKCSTWVQSQKQQNDLGSFPWQTIKYHSILSLCPNHWCWRNWSWLILWRRKRPPGTSTKKRSFHRELEYKSKKSRDTWSNRQVWPWSTKWSRAKTNRVLPRERTSHGKYSLPTTQETTLHMNITRLSGLKSDWLYLQLKMERLYTDSKNHTGSWLWPRLSASYCKFRLKLKRVWKTTLSFRYYLNKISYDYTVEVMNRFKGLHLVDRVPE